METVGRLLQDVRALPEDTHIVIIGDMNADPFLRKGINVAALRKLLATPQLIVIEKAQASSFTRPASMRHIDNAVVSRSAASRLAGPLEYFSLEAYRRLPSDHLGIVLSTSLDSATPRLLNFEVQFNTRRLMDGSAPEYGEALHTLSVRWLEWANRIREVMLLVNTATTEHLVPVLLVFQPPTRRWS